MFEWLSKIKANVTNSNKKLTKFQYMALIGLVGVFILLVSNLFGVNQTESTLPDSSLSVEDDREEEEEAWKQNETKNVTDKIKEIEDSYEKDLIPLLENIVGVSNVEIMINLEATTEQVYQKDLVIGSQITNETDQNGGTRKIDDETREQSVVIIRQGEQEVPLLVQTKKPDVRGVLVVAEGADNLEVKKWIMDSVSKVLDVGAHRISVMPKN
ncbi:stage III sporulation protein AG [Gracilibacillus sp. YIM 98692]|uniref:stage III sporulation protein AG n=1 Tax=Gracilibacillus sp. YIM 98692 TaxID=2663532 RepID=UPI001F08D965|nr:stage III sporulation protein AG [Gracilibacillus sp. YIM 98692]